VTPDGTRPTPRKLTATALFFFILGVAALTNIGHNKLDGLLGTLSVLIGAVFYVGGVVCARLDAR
jgi:drug/metabolite transporter (DMT)-like permease